MTPSLRSGSSSPRLNASSNMRIRSRWVFAELSEPCLDQDEDKDRNEDVGGVQVVHGNRRMGLAHRSRERAASTGGSEDIPERPDLADPSKEACSCPVGQHSAAAW